MMNRIILFIFLTCFCITSVYAKEHVNINYKDWKLDRPVVYGVVVGATFGLALKRDTTYEQAGPLDPYVIPSGMVSYLEKNLKFPFYLGFFLGSFFWVFILSTFVYRFKISRTYNKSSLSI